MKRFLLPVIVLTMLIACKHPAPAPKAQSLTSAPAIAVTPRNSCSYNNDVMDLGIGLIVVPQQFEIYQDSLLKQLLYKIDMYKTDDLLSLPCSKYFDPEYGIMQFVCLEVTDDAYKIITNYNEIKYLPKNKNYRFQTWETYIMQSYGIRRGTDSKGSTIFPQTLRKMPEDNADTLTIPEGYEMFCPLQMKGDWLQVKYDCFYNDDQDSSEPCREYINACQPSLTGWLQWRKDNKVLVDIFLMP
ncbi:hypothetical protein ACDQ55_18970 [Chitinophaga sp. 30R24]|uniref:hypothetical protein n=1 Tax=Chitinophaga sp. 30R24 TaxID=3248838 RepID=UPI003B8F0F92